MEAIRIGQYYDTTLGTLWKDGTYFPRGTRVMVVGLHVDRFCVRFPATHDGKAREIWHEWSEVDFLAPEGTIPPAAPPTADLLVDKLALMADIEDDDCHTHLHEE